MEDPPHGEITSASGILLSMRHSISMWYGCSGGLIGILDEEIADEESGESRPRIRIVGMGK